MVKSVERVSQILRLTGNSTDGLSNAQIAKTLNIPKSTLSALLNSLVSHGYLSLDASSLRYRLGPFLLALAGRYIGSLDMVKIGQNFLKQLTLKTEESSGLEIPHGPDIMLVAKEDSPQPVLHLLEIGERAPIYATAAGKTILAYRSDFEIKKYLDSVALVPFTDNTITDPNRIWEEIAEIRSGSLAYNRGELNALSIAIAAPVFDLHGSLIAALVVIMPAFRSDDKKNKIIEDALREASVALSHELGFEPEPKKMLAKAHGSALCS